MVHRRPFVFQDLPRELRDEVYDYLLVPYLDVDEARRRDQWRLSNSLETSIKEELEHGLRDHGYVRELEPTKAGSRCHDLTRTLSLAILATNHQIHDEASAVLYGRNIFKFTVCGYEGQALWQFGESHNPLLSSKYIRLITNVSFDVLYPDAMARKTLEEYCRTLAANLREIKVCYLDLGFLPSPDSNLGDRVLEPLKLLSGLNKVTFLGEASKQYKEELTKTMMAGPKDKNSPDNGRQCTCALTVHQPNRQGQYFS